MHSAWRSRSTWWRLEAADVAMHLRAASDDMDAILSARGVSERTRFAARLVCEEIALNAFEHGGARFVTMALDPANDPHLLFFEDDGVNFDPATRSVEPLPDTPGDIRTRGRGLILIHRSARRIEHRRDVGHNRLTVLLVE